jgi:hypothetical protein
MRCQAKACPGLDPGWKPVRIKKMRQIKNLEPRLGSIEAEKAPGMIASPRRQAIVLSPPDCRETVRPLFG